MEGGARAQAVRASLRLLPSPSCPASPCLPCSIAPRSPCCFPPRSPPARPGPPPPPPRLHAGWRALTLPPSASAPCLWTPPARGWTTPRCSCCATLSRWCTCHATPVGGWCTCHATPVGGGARGGALALRARATASAASLPQSHHHHPTPPTPPAAPALPPAPACAADTLLTNLLEVRDEFEVTRMALFDQARRGGGRLEGGARHACLSQRPRLRVEPP